MIKVRITGRVLRSGEELTIGEEYPLPNHEALYLIQAKRAQRVRAPKKKEDPDED